MIRLPSGTWKLVVERQTGLDHGWAISRRRGSDIGALLERHAIKPDASAEAAAAVAAALARSAYQLRPLRRSLWFGRTQAIVAAAAAVELLRLAGWSFAPGAVSALTEALLRGESHAGLVRHLCASAAAPEVDQLNAEVYLSAPVSNRNATTARLVDRWTPIIEEALESVGHEIGIDLFLRAPASISQQPKNLLQTVRRGLRHSVLHFVIGAEGGSVGIGREIDASIARRRPVIWLVPPGDRAPNSIVATGSEADLVIVPISGISELGPAVESEVKRNVIAIRDLLREKDSIPVIVMDFQEHLRRRWMRIPLSALPALLRAARITTQRAVLLITDPFVLLNETSISELDALSSVLGVDVLALRQDAVRRAAGL